MAPKLISLGLLSIATAFSRSTPSLLSRKNTYLAAKKTSRKTTAEEYEKLFAKEHDESIQAAGSFPRLEQDPWQEALLRPQTARSGGRDNNPYAELATWYLQHWRESQHEDDISHWGVDYRTYVDEYVAGFAEAIPLRDGDLVFESACGSGWLIRGLLEVKGEQAAANACGGGGGTVGDTVAVNQNGDRPAAAAPYYTKVGWYGNDILPDALALARRDVPGGQFVLGDSANLTWVGSAPSSSSSSSSSSPPLRFDLCLCGYVEPSADALVAGGFAPNAIQAWFGNWVKQMCVLAKPGGTICVGAVQDDLEAYDGSEALGAAWWVDAAASDAYGWGVEPASVQVRPMDSAILNAEWGARYNVRMVKKRG